LISEPPLYFHIQHSALSCPRNYWRFIKLTDCAAPPRSAYRPFLRANHLVFTDIRVNKSLTKFQQLGASTCRCTHSTLVRRYKWELARSLEKSPRAAILTLRESHKLVRPPRISPTRQALRDPPPPFQNILPPRRYNRSISCNFELYNPTTARALPAPLSRPLLRTPNTPLLPYLAQHLTHPSASSWRQSARPETRLSWWKRLSPHLYHHDNHPSSALQSPVLSNRMASKSPAPKVLLAMDMLRHPPSHRSPRQLQRSPL